MTNALVAEVCPISFEQDSTVPDTQASAPRTNRLSSFFNTNVKKQEAADNLAPRFKHKSNFPPENLEEIRRMLKFERLDQDRVEYDFWTPDYERMLKDDWLVSRFLLRGLKFSGKSICPDKSTVEEEREYTMYLHALNLIKNCAKFRLDYLINAQTRESEFPIEWLKQNGLFSYKRDLAENSVIYLRARLHKPKLIETDELRYLFKRYLLFTLEQGDRALFNQPGRGICCFFDMSKATLENIDLELLTWMVRSFKSYSPKLLCYVIVYNLPWFFSATFRLITNTLMPQSSKLNLRFVYGPQVYSYIARENLPTHILDELGASH